MFAAKRSAEKTSFHSKITSYSVWSWKTFGENWHQFCRKDCCWISLGFFSAALKSVASFLHMLCFLCHVTINPNSESTTVLTWCVTPWSSRGHVIPQRSRSWSLCACTPSSSDMRITWARTRRLYSHPLPPVHTLSHSVLTVVCLCVFLCLFLKSCLFRLEVTIINV